MAKLSAETNQYPELARLIGAYFHQDYDISEYGGSLEAIIAEYRRGSSETDVTKASEDILRFIQEYGKTDAALANAFVRVFSPGIIAEGWDGLTTRQWLLKIADLLA